MHIIILTTLYPTKAVPYGGTFIYERIKQLEVQEIPYTIYVIVRNYSKVVRLLYWFINGKKLQNLAPISWCASSKSILVEDTLSIWDIIIRYFHFASEGNRIFENLASKNIPTDSGSIIHAQYLYPLGYAAVKLAKDKHVPCVVTSHDSIAFNDISLLKNNSQKKVCETLALADKIICVSESNLEDGKQAQCIGDNSVVISNGLNPQIFYPMEKAVALEKTGFHQIKKYVVGFVGTLGYVKRADRFPDIFIKIKEIIPDVEFVLVGTGKFKFSVQKTCKDYGLHVTFIEPVHPTKVAAWMNLFDVLILPSRQESWGCVIREAYACGVPVVGSNIEGIPEAMGRFGCIVDEGKDFEKRFALAVSELLQGKIFVSKEELMRFAAQNTWEVCVKKEISIYQSVLNKDSS